MAGLSKSLVEVGISMVLRDGFSQQAGRVSSSYIRMMNDMNQWNRAVTQSAGATFDYGVSVIGKMTDAYKHYAELTGEMFMVGKIAGASAKESKQLMDLTQQINMATPLTNMDIASGERYLAMAGNSADKIEAMIGPAAELASVFQMQLGGKGGTADLMTNIMATFNIASRDAKKTSDILYTATTSANMNLTDLAQALQYSGSTFRNAGVDLATASAAIGVLGDQGIQASSAGTALANMLRYLTLSITGQKTKGTSMLEALGITKSDLTDSYGNLKDLGSLMNILATRMQGLSGTAREAAMYNIFGVRGQRAAAALFQALWTGQDKMASIITKSAQADGALHKTMEEWKQTPAGQLNMLSAAWDNLKTTIGGGLAPIFKPVITSITYIAQVFNWIGKTGVGKFMILGTASLAFTTTLIAGFRSLIGILNMVRSYGSNLSTSTSSAAGGMASMNSQAVTLEYHLRTLVALMSEYVALSYAPGTKGMVLPLGGRLGRNKAGKPYVGVGGKSLSTATYASTLAAAGAATVATSGATSGAGAAAGAAKLGLGSRLLGFMGGPWGVGLTIGLTALPYLIEWVGNLISGNTDALNDNTHKLSEQEIMADYQAKYLQAMQAMVVNTNKDKGTQSLNITVNGQPVDMDSSNSVSIDTYGLY